MFRMRPLANSPFFALSFLLWATLAGPLFALDEIPKPTIDAAILELADPDFAVREKATAYLWSQGKSAREALERAVKAGDPEIATRARQIVADFRYGIEPGMPPDIIAVIRAYRRAAGDAREQALADLSRMGRRGLPMLARLYGAEQDTANRERLFKAMQRLGPPAASALIGEGDIPSAEKLLLAMVNDGLEPATRSYAAFFYLNGQADRQIALIRKQIEAVGDPRQVKVLAMLHRASGDIPAARKIIEDTGDGDLLEAILFEQGDWAAMAARAAGGWHGEGVEALGFLAAYQRKAGMPEAFDQTIKRVQAAGSAGVVNLNSTDTLQATKALFLNDRPEEAIALMVSSGRKHSALEMLAYQFRYKEAFALAGKQEGEINQAGLRIAVAHARMLGYLGEKEQARVILDQIAAPIERIQDAELMSSLIEAEYHAGRDERGAELAAAAILAQPHGEEAKPLELLFSGRGAEAAIWLEALRAQRRNPDPKSEFARLRAVMRGRISADELDRLAADAIAAAMNLPQQRRGPILHTLADSLLAHHRTEPAKKAIEALAAGATSAAELTQLAGLAIKMNDWPRAADFASKAYEKDRSQVLPLYLHGIALLKMGQNEQGQTLVSKATLIPLADDAQRHALADGLKKAGLADAARQQYVILSRTGDFMSWELDNALRNLAMDAIRRNEHLPAADLWERATLDVLHSNTNFIDETNFLFVPHLIHRTRAVGLAKAGKFAAALAEADLCDRYRPGEIDVPIELVPIFKKQGKTKEAELLLIRSRKFHERLCDEYPRSPGSHNAVAWLLTRCGEDLDAALKHAQQAVDLDPQNTAILDTLAECLFQRGQRDETLEVMRKCIQLEPHATRHREQIKRIKEGDKTSSPPP